MNVGVNLASSGAVAASGKVDPFIRASLAERVEFGVEAEHLGYDSVWASEAYGPDAVSFLCFVGGRTTKVRLGTAVLQMTARQPGTTAQTAAAVDEMSGGRFVCGIGVSSVPIVEGWHGVPFGEPLRRTREYVAVLRQVFARAGAVEHHGDYYDIPYRGSARPASPLKPMMQARPDIPIYIGALGRKNIALTAEIADGWLPACIISPYRMEIFDEALKPGFDRRGGKPDRFERIPQVCVAIGDDLTECMDLVRPVLGMYVGMGPRGRNFYNDLVCRYGYEADAKRVQDLWLDGNRAEAIAAVPDALIDEVALVGPPARVAERLAAWRTSGIEGIVAGPLNMRAFREFPLEPTR